MSPHVLRRTCATLARDAGAPRLEDIQNQLGTPTSTSPTRYDLSAVVDRVPGHLWATDCAGTVTAMDEPLYGYGKAGRPLWSPRDRDAEEIRRVLRRGGFSDFDERHLEGFAVEGANSGQDDLEPFAVAYCGTARGV